MWHYNVTIQKVYVTHDPQNVWAAFAGVSGWQRIKPGAADGVTNVGALLSTAFANNRKVDVYLVSNEIQRAILH